MTATKTRNPILMGAALFCCLALTAFYANAAEENKTSPAKQDIAATLKGLPECTKFLECAEKCGVMTKLGERGPMTVLVPTNKAFENMPKEVCDKVKGNAELEKALCAYHVLKGNLSLEELKTTEVHETISDRGELKMSSVEITRKGNDLIQRRIECTNGCIYLINDVMIPDCCKPENMTSGLINKAEQKISQAARSVTETTQSAEKMTQDAVKSVDKGVKSAFESTESAIGEGMRGIGTPSPSNGTPMLKNSTAPKSVRPLPDNTIPQH